MSEDLTRAQKLELLDEAGFGQDESPAVVGRRGATQDITDDNIIAETDEKVKEKSPTQAEILLNIAEGMGAEFFADEIANLYAAIPVEGHTELLRLDGGDFRLLLQGLYYRRTSKPVSADALVQAVGIFSARARFEGSEPKKLNVRVAEHSSSFWYDLSNRIWQAVEVTPSGWRIVNKPPILFKRFKHQRAQVTPAPSGDVSKIFKYIPIKQNPLLFLVLLCCYFIPSIPRPMLVIYGEKGSGKTTTSEFMKSLVDPSALSTLTLKNDERDLLVNLVQHHFLVFDNATYINEATSNELCRAVTGGGNQARKLYSDDDAVIFNFQRCVLLNGVSNIVTRSDLLDRSVLIEIERLKEYRQIAAIRADFKRDKPEILGGIFGIISSAMQIFPHVNLDSHPLNGCLRMNDFSAWGYALAEAIEVDSGEKFLKEYAANKITQNDEAINSDPVAFLVIEFMRGRESWSGTATNLYSELTFIASENKISTRGKSFPQDPARLSKRLNGIKSNLEMAGVNFEKSKSGERSVTFTRRS